MSPSVPVIPTAQTSSAGRTSPHARERRIGRAVALHRDGIPSDRVDAGVTERSREGSRCTHGPLDEKRSTPESNERARDVDRGASLERGSTPLGRLRIPAEEELAVLAIDADGLVRPEGRLAEDLASQAAKHPADALRADVRGGQERVEIGHDVESLRGFVEELVERLALVVEDDGCSLEAHDGEAPGRMDDRTAPLFNHAPAKATTVPFSRARAANENARSSSTRDLRSERRIVATRRRPV